MGETSGAALRQWLLEAVLRLGNAAPRQQVHTEIERAYGAYFSVEDRLPRRGRPGNEQAWRNNVDSLYDKLKHAGVMEPSRQGDPWRLSALGLIEAASFGPGPPSESELLARFKPKDSATYMAEIEARTLLKTREHEALIQLFGNSVALNGWSPITVGVHPVDLVVSRGHDYLVEAKVVYRGNVSHAVREALAQLLEYRYFLYPSSTPPPRLLALFSETLGAGNCNFLRSVGIDSVWLQEGIFYGTSAPAHDRLCRSGD